MDDETFEQFEFPRTPSEAPTNISSDGVEGLQAMLIDGHVVSIELPMTVVMTAVECDPTIKGATAQAQLKPATTETGLIVQVPPYLSAGERIKVDTRDGHFVERMKD